MRHVPNRPESLTLEAFEKELTSVPKAKDAYDEHLAALKAARFIREMRQSAGLTQTEIAKRLGVSQALVGRLETGSGKFGPSIEMLRRIAEACQMEMVLSAVPVGRNAGSSEDAIHVSWPPPRRREPKLRVVGSG